MLEKKSDPRVAFLFIMMKIVDNLIIDNLQFYDFITGHVHLARHTMKSRRLKNDCIDS